MVGTPNDVEIVVKVDSKGAITTFDQLGNKLKNVRVESEYAGSATDDLARKFDRLGKQVGAVIGTYFTFNAAISTINRGAAVDDIASAFDGLANKAGVAANVLLNQLNDATGQTISNFELMQRANEAFLAGVKPDAYVQLTQAARALSETTGKDLKASIEQVTQAFITGQPRMLQNTLGVIDLKAAEEQLAKQLGTTAEYLSKEEQVTAARNAILEAAKKKTQEFGAITDDAGDKIAQFNKYLQDQVDAASRAIAGNQQLVDALGRLAEVVKNTDFTPLVNGITEFITAASNAASVVIPALNAQVENFRIGLATLKELMTGADWDTAATIGANSVYLSDQAAAAKDAARQTDIYNQSMDQATLSLDNLRAVSATYGDTADLQREAILQVQTALEKATTAINGSGEAADDKRAKIEALRKTLKGYESLLDTTTESEKKHVKTAKEQKAALKDVADKANEAKKKFDEYIKSQKELFEGAKKLNSPEGIAGMRDKIVKLAENVRELKLPNQELVEGIIKLREEFLKAGGGAEEFSKSLDAAKDKMEEMSKAAASASSSGSSSSPYGAAFEGGLQGMADQSGYGAYYTIGIKVVEALGQAFTSQEGAAQDRAKEAAHKIGLAFATYFSFGLAALGEQIFGPEVNGIIASTGTNLIVNKIIEHVLPLDSAGTAFRKHMDKFFAEALKGNPLQAIINKQLQTITDIDFGGTMFGHAEASAQQFFDGLTASAQGSFTAIAAALAKLSGESQDLVGAFAAVLAENLGGSLNNLQLLMEAAGIKASDLRTALIEAFLDGELTIEQVQDALLRLNQAMQDGIPDAVGDVKQAFDNLMASGDKGGRATVDAIRDIAAEAQEAGITSLEGLKKAMVEKFGISQEAADRFFKAMQVAGINSFEELKNASIEDIIAIAANFNQLQKGLEATNQSTEQPDISKPQIDTGSFKSGGSRGTSGGSRTGGSSGQSEADRKKAAAAAKAEREKQARLREVQGIERLLESSKDYKQTLDDLSQSKIDSASASEKLNELYKQAADLYKTQETAEAKLFDARQKEIALQNRIQDLQAKGKKISADEKKELKAKQKELESVRGSMGGLISAYESANKAVDDFKGAQEKAKDPTAGQNEQIKQLKKTIEPATIAVRGFADAYQQAFNHLDEASQAKMSDLFKSLSMDINQTQVAVQAIGMSFDQMKKAAIDSFLAGKTSATEALKAIQDSGQGIPGQVGAVGEAFNNLAKYGQSGGRLTIDALKDIEAEAKEVGANTYDDMIKIAEAQGVNVGALQDLVAEMEKQGIKFGEIQNISDETAIKIIADLADSRIGFQETSSEISKLLAQMDELANTKYEIQVVLKTSTEPQDPAAAAIGANMAGEPQNNTGSGGDSPSTPALDADTRRRISSLLSKVRHGKTISAADKRFLKQYGY